MSVANTPWSGPTNEDQQLLWELWHTDATYNDTAPILHAKIAALDECGDRGYIDGTDATEIRLLFLDEDSDGLEVDQMIIELLEKAGR